MGFESAYRNDIATVADYLRRKHDKHYRIFNLCSERDYPTDVFNDSSVVMKYGFPDHHNPPLDLIMQLCQDINSFLNSDPENVIVIHCLAGRGRTGTVIACYLTYSGLYDNGSEALEHFARKRSHVHRGVQQPSQRRYVQYFSEILAGRKPKSYSKSLRLKQIVMYTIPNFGPNHTCQPVLEIFTSPTRQNPKKLLFSSLRSRVNFDPKTNEPRTYKYSDGTITIDVNTELQGDIYLRCYHFTNKKLMVRSEDDQASDTTQTDDDVTSGTQSKKKEKEKEPGKFMFRLSLHTGFVPHPSKSSQMSILRLTKTEIDDAVKSKKFEKDFFMDLIWERLEDQKKKVTNLVDEEGIEEAFE